MCRKVGRSLARFALLGRMVLHSFEPSDEPDAAAINADRRPEMIGREFHLSQGMKICPMAA